jgi:hypothetical protein
MEEKRPMDIRFFTVLNSFHRIGWYPSSLCPHPPSPFGHLKLRVHVKSRVCCFVCGKLVRGESAEAKEASSVDRSIDLQRKTERIKGERWGTMWRCRSMERSRSEGRGQGLLLGRWQEGRDRWGGTERRFSLSCLSTLELLHQEM